MMVQRWDPDWCDEEMFSHKDASYVLYSVYERDTAQKVRPEVMAFALAMEAKLKANDHKGGWQDMFNQQIVGRINDELGELEEELLARDINSFRVRDECVDVANFTMMLFDNFGEEFEVGDGR